jgi:indole-3-glycerol phosphate synthase/phosphoribosylanthranilate isomerase
MKQYIDWDTSLVFESGISSAEDVAVALRSGFSGILVGEAVVRRPELIRELRQRLVNTGGNRHSAATGCSASTARTATGRSSAPHTRFFWEALFARKQEGRPLVKICGITNEEDLLYSDAAGADILGFILAPSKRQVTPEFIATLPQTKALKVGVYVGDRGERELPQEITELLVGGKLDCMQFHGDESPGACFGLGFPYYKAFRMRDMADIDAIGEYHCPRVLIDAFSRSSYGGTGKRVADDIVTEAASRNPLWLAGGVTPENVTAIVARHRPELIDVSSGVETAPGRKDKHKIERLFYELRDAATEKERKRHAAAD